MEFVADLPSDIEPLRLGMTRDEARPALEAIGPLPPAVGGEVVSLASGVVHIRPQA